jgi:hypothetical protein
MWSGDANPAEYRDRLKNTNNMWTYPQYLDAHGPVKAHIDMTRVRRQSKRRRRLKNLWLNRDGI